VRLVDFCLIYAFIESRRRYIRDQPLLHLNVTDLHPIWYFEDWLKSRVARHPPGLLVAFSLDPRMQSLASIPTLLRSYPEQERNALFLLVEKLVRLPHSFA
jgi:hypothetical protein